MAKKKKRNLWNALLLLLAVPIILYALPTGPISGVTGGFGEPTCSQAACPLGIALDSGPGSVAITVPGTYNSDETFSVTVTVSDPDQQRWGFELSARTLNGQQAGNLIPGTDGRSQLLSSSNGIQYIGHTVLGVRPGTTGGVSFDFMWEAPDVSAGTVIFHAAGDGANNDFGPSGDNIYKTEAMSEPPQVSGQPPSVNDGGIVHSADFSAAPVSPGLIASIFGTNLTKDGATELTFFGSDGKLATTLAGASVEVNGIAAPLFFASPGQINAMIPTELTGVNSATVEVTVDGQTSAPQTIFVDPSAPGIFTMDSSGIGQGAILHVT
ncbi:MAG: hypothetical protein IH846_18290, partial [Acidobacteria bacterium]|nr:hypothetical protein [Acidobacteriota bacterium]